MGLEYGNAPMDRVTRIADAATDAAKGHDEAGPRTQVITLVFDLDTDEVGTSMYGYPGLADVVGDLLEVARELGKIAGVGMRIVPMPKGGGTPNLN